MPEAATMTAPSIERSPTTPIITRSQIKPTSPITYQTQLRVVSPSKLQGNLMPQTSSTTSTFALSISPSATTTSTTNSSVTIPFQIAAIPLNKILSIQPQTNQTSLTTTPTGTVQIQNLTLLEQNNKILLPPSTSLLNSGTVVPKVYSNNKKKNVTTMKYMLQPCKVGHLYKCVLYECDFSTNEKRSFEEHVNVSHVNLINNNYNCIYCNNKMRLIELCDHYQNVHGNSKYNCSYCFYKAVCVSYVKAHIRSKHPKHVIQVRISADNENQSKHVKTQSRRNDQEITLYECGEDGEFVSDLFSF